jgi:hypothetical protein
MRKHDRPALDDEEEPLLATEVPTAPNRDLGTGGTKEVDGPPNTDGPWPPNTDSPWKKKGAFGDVPGTSDVPEPPD